MLAYVMEVRLSVFPKKNVLKIKKIRAVKNPQINLVSYRK